MSENPVPLEELLEWSAEWGLSSREEEMAARLRSVAAKHFHDGNGWCSGCGYGWPCETDRALAGEREER